MTREDAACWDDTCSGRGGFEQGADVMHVGKWSASALAVSVVGLSGGQVEAAEPGSAWGATQAGALLWAHPLTGPSDEFGKTVNDRDGGSLSMVDFTGSIDLGAGPILAPTSPAGRALVLARHDAQGNVRVVRLFSNLHGLQHTVESQRNIVLIAEALAPITGSDLLDEGPLLMKPDASGRLLWLRPIPYTHVWGQSLVTDREGNIGVAGLGRVGSSPRLTFTKYSAEGVQLWRFLDTKSAQSDGRAAAVDSEGNFFVAGQASSSVSHSEPLLLMLSPQGQERWRRQLAGSIGFSNGVATHGNRVVLVGTFARSFTFAGRPHTSVANGLIDQDAFVAAWTRDGEERWAWNFGFDVEAVAMDEQDGVVVVGGYQAGSPDLGALGPLPGNPASNSKDGRPTILGLFHDRLTVGSSTWTASGYSDLFLMRFEP